MRATKRALWGALELGLTDACRAGAGELVAMWGHPDQEEGPLAFAEKREPDWQPLEALEPTRELLDVRLPRSWSAHGPVGWLINNRPDQLNAMTAADARRVRGSRGRSSTPTPRCA